MTVVQPVLPLTVVIEDFDWQNTYSIAPLRHSVLYPEKIREVGDDANVSTTVYVLLSSSKPTSVWKYMICHVRHSALLGLYLSLFGLLNNNPSKCPNYYTALKWK